MTRATVEQQFQATVQKKGSRVFIQLPFDPNEVWGQKPRHYIHGTINQARIRSLLKVENDVAFISLGAAFRRDSGIDAGTEVTVIVAPEGPQQETMAADIAAAFTQEPAALEFFNSLATFYRRNYIKWIEGAKRPATRTKRISEMIDLLNAGKRQK